MNEDKFILDATAGFRNIWNGMHQGVLFLDRRREVKPHIVASNEQMPFRDGIFPKIVYDPPHLIRNSPITNTCLMKGYEQKFTVWKTKSQFLKNMVLFAKEALRVLEPRGELSIKHTESPDNPITKHVVINIFDSFKLKRTRQEESRGFGKSKVFWFTFMKIPEV